MQHDLVTSKTAEHIGQTMTYGGAVSAVASWGLSWPEIAAIVGATVAVLGFALQVWATFRRDRRETEIHWLRIEEYQERDE